MKQEQAILQLKFQSLLSPRQLFALFLMDAEGYRRVPGLIQKYDLEEDATGAFSSFFLFESAEARAHFLASQRAADFPERYGVIPSSLRLEQYECLQLLQDGLLLDC